MLKSLFVLLLIPLFLSGCSNLTVLLNAATPDEGYRIIKDVAYGPHPRQKLDVYVPDVLEPQKSAVLFFYGGSWQWGSKDQYKFVGQALASLGYVALIADYRLYPDVSFPAFVDDAALATVWAHQNAAQYGADGSRLFVAGHSAGGYLGKMLAANPAYLQSAGGNPSMIRGTIAIAAPLDFLPLTSRRLQALFSTAPELAQTQPITFVRAGMPPALLATGTDDRTVLPKNSQHMATKMKAMGNRVQLREYADINHYAIMLSLANGFRSYSPLLTDIQSFISNH